MASSMPAPSVNAATMPTTAATEPMIAGRAGSAVAPRPEVKAKRAPTTVGSGSPSGASTRSSH